jgi:hypothetical protein
MGCDNVLNRLLVLFANVIAVNMLQEKVATLQRTIGIEITAAGRTNGL